ncbi:DUF2460 domain-containing protein [Aquisalinus flavus]|uniref:Glycoside hydrolase family 24 n=1 Tax=Aquisalinus flavus TaxID=1526572 RepID=A0A8J2V1M1_9PROT|nr:DUF2460 domain-containing protein [Aquisalinus flavus]MBD0426293.1 DUF2460 domain-containing protein [Aquisalinus flavus]UNE48139.1 TIGR02217 family protein [Aquisalinus flavus]GGD09109.1 glycoside hydrolase family 24 [Aquisalinus flavus]
MAFHDIRFPVDISLSSAGGPERRTDIVTLASGHEERNSPWAGSRRRFNAGYGIKSLPEIEQVIAFFEARHGRLHAFRWRDPFDWKSCSIAATPQAHDQPIGTGDGEVTQFRLSKTYASGGHSHVRAITKPVAGTVLVAVNGVLLDPTDYSVDISTGLVTFATAPADDVALTAGFEFDIAVRFDSDTLSISLAALKAGDIPDIPVIEVLS